MHRIKLMVEPALGVLVLFALLQNPGTLTSGAFLHASHGMFSVLGAYVNPDSLRLFMGLIGLVIAGVGIRQAVKLRPVRKGDPLLRQCMAPNHELSYRHVELTGSTVSFLEGFRRGCRGAVRADLKPNVLLSAHRREDFVVIFAGRDPVLRVHGLLLSAGSRPKTWISRKATAAIDRQTAWRSEAGTRLWAKARIDKEPCLAD